LLIGPCNDPRRNYFYYKNIVEMKMVKEINYLAFKCLKLQTYYDNNISVGPCYDGHAS
jgi:hypothetical protein